jgi:hypothetical protein
VGIGFGIYARRDELNNFSDYNNDEQEEKTIGSWIEHDVVGASHALGEDLVFAVSEALDYE